MDEEKLRKIVEAVLTKQAANAEHKRLQAKLDAWAKVMGYAKKYKSFNTGERPDVLRHNPAAQLLFVGDAKDAEHETARNSDTVARISTYIAKFGALLGTDFATGGIIAIATNSEQEAKKWRITLGILCLAQQISSADGGLPNFKVKKLDQRTWVTYW